MIANPFYDCFWFRPLAEQRDKLLVPEQKRQTRKQFEMLFRRHA
jgi:hypothetical protein